MSDDYEVGYKKPPKPTQFQKGQSGNPKGRPKGTKNFKTDLLEELSEHVLITEDNKESRISKQRAILKRTVQKALGGDMRAAGMLVSWTAQFLGVTSESADAEHISADDQAIIDRYIAEIQQAGTDNDPTRTPDDD